jgi:pimeloyl-ACP methyl ester carboxylesterase
MYKGMMHTRCDDRGIAYYFSAKDFPGLNVEEYTFKSSKGHVLQGYIYNYDNPIEGRLIVFDHGFGGGHRSYMREIEMLCKHGYKVFTYDHTGCMESGGESPNGMAQSLCDLNDCIAMIKADEKFAGLDISVMGHSWGGFSTMNISALHPEISHVVSMSGFVSVDLLVGSFFGGILKGFRKPVLELERNSNPEFVGFNAVESLKKNDAKVLLIYSDNDKLVRRDIHFDALKKGLEDRENIGLLLVNNKGHNPNYTEDAVKYLAEYSALLQKKTKKKELQSI